MEHKQPDRQIFTQVFILFLGEIKSFSIQALVVLVSIFFKPPFTEKGQLFPALDAQPHKR